MPLHVLELGHTFAPKTNDQVKTPEIQFNDKNVRKNRGINREYKDYRLDDSLTPPAKKMKATKSFLGGKLQSMSMADSASSELKRKSSVCVFCQKVTKSRSDLYGHYCRNHFLEELLGIVGAETKECKQCQKKFSGPAAVVAHFGRVHNLIEEVLPQKYHIPPNKHNPRNQARQAEEKPDLKLKIYRCKACTLSFSSCSAYAIHLAQHKQTKQRNVKDKETIETGPNRVNQPYNIDNNLSQTYHKDIETGYIIKEEIEELSQNNNTNDLTDIDLSLVTCCNASGLVYLEPKITSDLTGSSLTGNHRGQSIEREINEEAKSYEVNDIEVDETIEMKTTKLAECHICQDQLEDELEYEHHMEDHFEISFSEPWKFEIEETQASLETKFTCNQDDSNKPQTLPKFYKPRAIFSGQLEVHIEETQTSLELITNCDKVELENASVETKVHCDHAHLADLLTKQNFDNHQALFCEQLKVEIEETQASVDTKLRSDQADVDQELGIKQLKVTMDVPLKNIETRITCCQDSMNNVVIAQAADEKSDNSEITKQVVSILKLTFDSVVDLTDPASDLEEGELHDSDDEENKKLDDNKNTVASFDIRAVLDLDSDDDD